MLVHGHSDVSGNGTTICARNSALDSAGAISVASNSTISKRRKTAFACNVVVNNIGGALVVHNSFQAFWSGKMTFANDAMVLEDYSTASWTSETSCTANTVAAWGTIYIKLATHDGNTTFKANTVNAGQGGALSIAHLNDYFRDKTTFIHLQHKTICDTGWSSGDRGGDFSFRPWITVRLGMVY